MRSAVLAAAVLLAGGELFLRARLGPPPDESAWSDSDRYLGEESRRPFFAASPAPGGGTLWSPARPRSTAKPFVEPKPAGLKRVFVAGESVAQLLPADALEAALGGRGVEVINCGMGAYDAGRVAGVVRDALERSPDRLVVLAGNNDGAPDDGLPAPARRLNALLRRSRLWRSAQDALHPPGPRPGRTELDARFERNLRAIARAARAKNVPLTLCTLPVNERDWPPSGELPLDAPTFFAAWRAWDAGRAAQAAPLFDKFVSERPADPMGRYWLARALERTGRARDAAAEYGKAVELDWPARCTRARNELIRRIAREEKAGLADLDAWARGRSKDGAPGFDLFDDGVHWKAEFDAPIAAVIAGSAAKPSSARPRGPATLRAISDSLQASLEYDPPILSEQAVAEFRAARKGDGEFSRRLSDEKAVEAELAKNPWTSFHAGRVARHWTSVRLHAAEARWRDGDRRGALEDFRAAAAADPGSALARLLTAKAELGLGLKKEAAADLDAVPAGSREAVLAALYRRELE